jgi:hypothetical protein
MFPVTFVAMLSAMFSAVFLAMFSVMLSAIFVVVEIFGDSRGTVVNV